MQTENTFEYEKSEVKLKHGTKYVEKITFAIDRFGNFTQTIKFSKKKTERKAISEIEAWLSRPITEEYFRKLENTFPYTDLRFSELDRRGYLTKGDLLGGCIFLEGFDVVENDLGHVFLVTGS